MVNVRYKLYAHGEALSVGHVVQPDPRPGPLLSPSDRPKHVKARKLWLSRSHKHALSERRVQLLTLAYSCLVTSTRTAVAPH